MSETKLAVKINEKDSSVTFNEVNFSYAQVNGEASIAYEDVIGFENHSYEYELDAAMVTKSLFYIISTETENKLKKDAMQITATPDDLILFEDLLNDHVRKVIGRPKSAIVLVNPISGSANSESIYREELDCIFKMAKINTKVVVSEKPDHFKEIAASLDFSPFDVIAIMGGDGTLSMVLNELLNRKQLENGKDQNDPTIKLETVDKPIAIIPSGSGNGKAWKAYGCIDILTATLHILKGRTKVFPVLGNFCGDMHVAYSVIITAYGRLTDVMQFTDAHRWLKKLRYVFIPLWFYLFKEIRRYDASVKLECLKTDKNVGKDIEIEQKSMTLTLTNVLAVNDAQTFFYDLSFNDLPSGEFFPFLLYAPTSRMNAFKQYVSYLSSPKQRTKEEVEALGYVSIYPVTSITVEVQQSQSDLNLLINIDGETHRLPYPKITVRLLKNAYKIYTSFENEGTNSKQ